MDPVYLSELEYDPRKYCLEQVDLGKDPLNFLESGWWSRILSSNESTDSNFDRFGGGGV